MPLRVHCQKDRHLSIARLTVLDAKCFLLWDYNSHVKSIQQLHSVCRRRVFSLLQLCRFTMTLSEDAKPRTLWVDEETIHAENFSNYLYDGLRSLFMRKVKFLDDNTQEAFLCRLFGHQQLQQLAFVIPVGLKISKMCSLLVRRNSGNLTDLWLEYVELSQT